MEAPKIKRFHENSLKLGMRFGVEDGYFVVEKFGLMRSASLDDPEEVWRILTNDMEFNEKTAEKILELVATKAAVAGREVF